MKILAVETSGLEASVALAEDDRLLAEEILDTAGRRNARLLLPAVDQLLKQNSWQPGDVDVVAVSIGPGSFTGLRVGVVFAKTFAWLNDARLIAVDTLQALAQRVTAPDCEIVVISDAQRGDVFVNSYQGDPVLEPVGTVRIASLDSVLAELQNQPQQILAGPGVRKFSDRIPETVLRASDHQLMPQASALLPAARRLIAQEHWADPDTLEPLYLRRSYAEEKRQPTGGA